MCSRGCGATEAEIGLDAAREVIARHADDPGGLIPTLQEVQREYGYLSETVLEEIARGRNVPLASVYGVATFFAQLRLSPLGRHQVKVCHGTACYVSGAGQITQALERELDTADGRTTEDGEFTLESVACLGCCGLAPVMLIGQQAYGKLTPEAAVDAVVKTRKS